MKRVAFFYSLMFICLAAAGTASGQTKPDKACPFNIVGTWKSAPPTAHATNIIYFRFAPDGTVTLLSPSTDIQRADFETVAGAKYKLDKPAAPKRLDIIAARGNEVFSKGTTSMEIAEYGDDSFTTVDPAAGMIRWERAKTKRYFLTFAARSGSLQDGGPAFAMWTRLDGRQTETDALGIHLVTDNLGRIVPTVGPIPAPLVNDFLSESNRDSDVMFRVELSEAEYERTYRVYKTWSKRVKTQTLLYDDPYLNAMEFIRRAAESLNQCREKVKLHKMTWLTSDEVVTRHNLPQHPLEYIRIMRQRNSEQHVTNSMYPADWKPAHMSSEQ